jgi:hypothetical protein
MVIRQISNQITRILVKKAGGDRKTTRQINQLRRVMRWLR